MRKYWRFLILIIPILCLVSAFTYYLPPVHDRLAWRVDEFVLMVKYKLNPPGKVVFVPQSQETAAVQISAPASATPSPIPTSTATPVDVAPQTAHTPAPTAEPTAMITPLPEKITLSGVRYTDQHGRLNYCAPANLTMALTFWGWDGERNDVGKVLILNFG